MVTEAVGSGDDSGEFVIVAVEGGGSGEDSGDDSEEDSGEDCEINGLLREGCSFASTDSPARFWKACGGGGGLALMAATPNISRLERMTLMTWFGSNRFPAACEVRQCLEVVPNLLWYLSQE